ncbi:MAG: helix-turn-helix domain-containing protein [Campylobacteraceae bacterium]|jgi:predicted transcriptional regulator|nr:helix-turn-helix domain-containing protein [Campylobacteraceae bacterium]
MKKLTVSDAANALGITKEAVYNRVRRGTLESVTQDGERYIIIDDENKSVAQKLTPVSVPKSKNTAPDERYINLLVSQINELKSTNTELNRDKERLIREKEQLLMEQRIALETIYKERDEQLKAILTLANRSLLARSANNDELTIEASYEPPLLSRESADEGDFTDWRELKSYLKAKGLSRKKKKKIISQAKKVVGVDGDVQEDEGILYVKREKIKQFI